MNLYEKQTKKKLKIKCIYSLNIFEICTKYALKLLYTICTIIINVVLIGIMYINTYVHEPFYCIVEANTKELI